MSCCENNNEKQDSCSSGNNNCCNGKSLIVFLLIVSIVANLGTGYYLTMNNSQSGSTDGVATAVLDKYLANEYKKAGSKENYDLLATAQRLQMQDQLPEIKKFIASKGGVAQVTPGETTASGEVAIAPVKKALTQDEIMAIKKNAYIEGNKDAIITLVEYSDPECPYCIRQFKDGTIKKVHDKFGDKVNSIFKNFRGVPHENSEAEANAMLCAGEIGGLKAYVAYYNAVFTRNNGSNNGTGFSKDALLPLAKELKLDPKKFQGCVDSKKNIAQFDADTAEGAKLGVQGTPGTVVINNKTGEYELIAGAFPVSEFERVVTKLLGNE